jgi:type III restriction enzyme
MPYVRKDRSEPEKFFELQIDRSEDVEWWYKNGEGLEKYFAIEYQWENSETRLLKLAGFYPDYIVRYRDGSTGIYDTKAGMTVTEPPTPQKSDALQAYVAEQNAKGARLKGGIINRRQEGLFIYTDKEYDPDLSRWSRFTV